MKKLREAIQSIIQDDALYKRRDLPGDVDDPVQGSCDSSCSCQSCSQDRDFVTPKYALYSLIGDAIDIYDEMESDDFRDNEKNDRIMRLAEIIKSMKH